MKEIGHFCLIKTYVLGLNMGDLIYFLLNRRSYLTLEHNYANFLYKSRLIFFFEIFLITSNKYTYK